MNEPVVMEIPGTDFAVTVSTVDQATRPLDLPARELPGIGRAVPFLTPLDAAAKALRAGGYDVISSTIEGEQIVQTWRRVVEAASE